MKKKFKIIVLIFLLFPFTAEAIDWESVFSDQSKYFFYPSLPTSSDTITIRLWTGKKEENLLVSLCVKARDEDFVKIPMKNIGESSGEVYYVWEAVLLPSPKKRWYCFEISDKLEHSYWGIGGKSKELSEDFCWQIIPDYKIPEWVFQSVFYQIFPDRFADGDKSNNVKEGEYEYLGVKVYTHKSWDELPQNPTKCADFFGGDLWGIIEKLDYLYKLGINGIYLNPIFLSPSNHKYDTQDWRQVDPHFGGNGSLEALVKYAHSLGIKLILDGVFNHSGDWHYWFDRNHIYNTYGAYESRESEWFDFYTFKDWPGSYVCWWGFPTLPKLNYGSFRLRKEIYKGPQAIAKVWLSSYGVDGWRLDVPNEVGVGKDGNAHWVWKEFREEVRSVAPQSYLVGEIWGPAEEWLGGDEFDGVMNYWGFLEPLWCWLAHKDLMLNSTTISSEEFAQILTRRRNSYFLPAYKASLNLLDSHDTQRILSLMEGDREKVRLAITLQFTWDGTPMIYYGDEIGLTGGKDPDCRRTFPWDTSKWDGKVLKTYQKLINLRKNHKAFKEGALINLLAIQDEVYAFGRVSGEEKVVVVLNSSTKKLSFSIPVWKTDIRKGIARSFWSEELINFSSGMLKVDMPSKSSEIYFLSR